MHQRVLANHTVDLGFRFAIEVVVGGAHVGELGVATVLVEDAAGEQRILCWNGPEGGVRVPQHIADIEEVLPAILRQGFAVLAEVGDVVHALGEALVLRLRDVAAAGVLERTEVPREVLLLLIGYVLAVKDEDAVLVHASFNGRGFRLGERFRQVDARYFARDRGELADANGHGSRPPHRFSLCSVCARASLQTSPRLGQSVAMEKSGRGSDLFA